MPKNMPHKGTQGRRALTLSLALAMSACTVVGPDYQAPPQPVLPSSWTAEELATESEEIGAWWQRFNDPILTNLIERGAQQNLSIEAAGLRIVQARAALGIADALIFPQQQQLNGNFTGLYQNKEWFKSAGASFDVGWEIDIWGKYARGIESAEAGLYASIASYHDVLVTISAEIARNYINYRTAQERKYLSQRNIAIQQRVVDMTEVKFKAGDVSELDVQQAKTQLYATQSALPALSIAQSQARNALAVLLGTVPENVQGLLGLEEPRAPASFSDGFNDIQRGTITVNSYSQDSVIPKAPQLTSGINPQLVLRRPDLQVAELSTRAQSARIGLTAAELYPQFYLFGSVGVNQTVKHDKSFGFSDAVTAAVGPGISWNIFQYGRIKNQIRVEDARFQESLTNYNQSVLQAVAEVSNAIDTYQNTLEKSDYDFEGVKASIRAFSISATQYNNGLVSYQRLLSTVEKMTLREDAYAQTRGNISQQVVALYKALGGGWQPLEGKPLKPETVEQMKARVDWGDQLEPQAIEGGDLSE
ncbi:MAG: outer membrane protein TolC [Halioglobus sp.]|jgi:outer membrane protein TolC